jgi:serine/threonine protein phosphatase PrpC
MKNLVDEKTEIAPEKFKLKDLKVAIDRALANSSLSIDREFFARPGKAAVMGLIQPSFIKWLVASGVSRANLSEADLFTSQNVTRDHLNSTRSVRNAVLPVCI